MEHFQNKQKNVERNKIDTSNKQIHAQFPGLVKAYHYKVTGFS